jgi:serine/threonine-protein kinase
MAPEQLLGGPVDARVDVYALGVLLHRLVTGRPPFEASTPAALARKHLEEPAPRPSRLANVGPAIDAVVLRCMEKRPERRFDSTKSFVAALAAALGRDYDGPQSSRAVPTLGIAVYLDLRVNITGDELDDALGRDVGTLLDLAEERLARGGFALVQATGSGVLGVRPAGRDEVALRRDRRAAIALASALHAQIASRPGADARVHANVALHVGEVMLHHEGAREIVGGSLISTAAWAPRSELAGIAVTPAMIEGLGELDAPLTVLPL